MNSDVFSSEKSAEALADIRLSILLYIVSLHLVNGLIYVARKRTDNLNIAYSLDETISDQNIIIIAVLV